MLSFVCGWWSFRVNIGLSLATHLCSDRFYYNSAKYAITVPNTLNQALLRYKKPPPNICKHWKTSLFSKYLFNFPNTAPTPPNKWRTCDEDRWRPRSSWRHGSFFPALTCMASLLSPLSLYAKQLQKSGCYVIKKKIKRSWYFIKCWLLYFWANHNIGHCFSMIDR